MMKSFGKKTLALLLTAVLLLSMLSVTAFAADEKPEPTVGPTEDAFLYGGARLGTYEPSTSRTRYIVNYNYSEGGGLLINNEAVSGATYDRESNTLTIDNVHQKANQLFIWYMGDDFKLNVVGENEFGIIYVYNYFNFHSTSLNIIGTGTLTVNQELINKDAIHMVADGDSTMHLDIADSVNVHLYSKEDESGEQAPVVTLHETTITPKEDGAITVGGKTAPEAQNEQIMYEDFDYVPVVKVEDLDRDVIHGTQLKSKSDPDGVYAVVDVMDGVTYVVVRFIYVDELGAWARDPAFAEDWYAGQRYTKAELEAEFDYVYGQAPTPIRYMPEYRIESRGNEGVKMLKDDEPDAVYIGQPTGAIWDWDDTHPYSGNYEIHRVIWDDSQAIYVEDTSFKEIDLVVAELEENGFHVVEESRDEHLTLTVWTSDDPEDTSRFDIMADSMKRKSDPDGLYVKLGTYGYESGDPSENGILVYKVHYNPETDEHYVMYNSYDEPECFFVSYGSLESGEGDFSYETETVTEPVWANYLPEDYSVEWDLHTAVQLKKNEDPDAVYAYTHSTHYFEDDTTREEYGLMKLQYNEAFGCYVEDTDFDEIVFYDLNDLASMGYEIVMSEQPLDFVTKGSVYFSEYPAYTDNDGGTYYADYSENVYSYTDEDLITIGGEQYYYGTPMPEMSTDDLNDTIHETLSDNYNYWISGPEYHHAGTDVPAPQNYTLSGKLTSYLDDEEYVRITLLNTEENRKINYTTRSGDGAYQIDNVPAGTYTMTVEKKSHVTRDYEITVSGNTVQDVKICPIGDVNGNGRVQSNDGMFAYKHAQGGAADKLEGYAFKCADVNNNGRVQSNDAMAIYKQASGEHNLF
ncbi:MAG: hypothetical protein IJV48_00940 [Ruminococcus sp.]|nr:hypothetical protein [Ruminococcus sp.]